jgi:uncharacterized C2H2 Zn-finger protein
MTTLVNTTEPYLRILLPDNDFIQFQGGKLELPEDHPFYQHVMDEAVRRPSIAVLINETTCPYCGEVFKGDKAAAKYGAHIKEVHFELWQKEQDLEHARIVQKEVKARAGFSCDVCSPIQTFGTADDLAEHVGLFHTNPEEMDAAGNTTTAETRPGEKVIHPRKTQAKKSGPAPDKPPSEINALRAEAKSLGLKGSGTKIELQAAIAEAKAAAAPVGEKIADNDGDELEHGADDPDQT